MIYNVGDFGAVGDGSHNDTTTIQVAVDVCNENFRENVSEEMYSYITENEAVYIDDLASLKMENKK